MKETFICIVNEKGKTFYQGQVPPDPEAIAFYLKPLSKTHTNLLILSKLDQ